MKRILPLLLILALSSLACQALSGAQPTATLLAEPDKASPAPTEIVQVVSTRTPTVTLPPVPSNVPEATITRAPTAVAPTRAAPEIIQREMDPHGPWLLFVAQDGLYAVNADGSGLTWLTDETHIDLASELSPDREKLAYVMQMIPGDYATMELFIYDLPGQKLERVTSVSPAGTLGDTIDPLHPAFEAARAIYDYSPPAWSPSGERLAFMGAQDGPSSDLYVYTLTSSEIDRLTDGPSQGYAPSWSPDGEWIVHFGVETFGTGAGYTMSGAWAAHWDGDPVNSLYRPANTAAETLVGWLGPQTFLVHSWDAAGGAKGLRSINAASGAASMIWAGYFNEFSLAVDPESGASMLSVSPGLSEVATGMYLVQPDGSSQRVLDTDGIADWSAAAGLFLVKSAGEVRAFTPQGEAISIPGAFGATVPVASPGGEYWAYPVNTKDGDPGVYITVGYGSTLQISSESSTQAIWSEDGQHLFFFTTDGDLYVATAPDFLPVQVGVGFEVTQAARWAGGTAADD